jgi:pyruvate dehydrogenase E2 component (dihydrolipoamide acetyltransferase)
MPLTLTMPKLSPTMEEGTLIKWHKKVGDAVKAGDLLIEVATDKATVEYNALDEGWIRQILVQEGEDALVNQPIAVLTAEQNEAFEPISAAPHSPSALTETQNFQDAPAKQENEKISQPSRKEEIIIKQPQFTPEAPLENYTFNDSSSRSDKRLVASPLAKKLAKERGLDLSTVKGSGPNQRIMSRDLEKAHSLSSLTLGSRQIPAFAPGSFEEIPLSQMRKTISQRLQESKSFIPHFYITQTVDIEPLVVLREQLKNQQMKISINDFIVKACALALKKCPKINRGFNSAKQAIIQFKTIDIAIAVSLEAGLITPIVRHADFKSLNELAIEIRSLAQRAREGKLELQEYKGGSFTISNLGMYGVSHFQAILNPPQAAILAVGGIQEVPVVRQQQIVPGKILNLTLSVDHRVIDGVAAAVFLKELKEIIENPAILLIS